MLEVMRGVLLCIRGAVEGGLCLLKALEMMEVPEGVRRVLLCMLEDEDGELCVLEVSKVIRWRRTAGV